MNNLTDAVIDMLASASDYIGNSPNQFGADNDAMKCIIANEKFRQYVSDEVSDYPDEYEDIPQEEAARLVWDMYLSWAY